MNKTLPYFIAGVILTLATVGGVLLAKNYLAQADTSREPQNVKARRVSPTAGEVSFTTEKESTAAISCSTSQTGPFSICGAETAKTSNHKIRLSLILDPQKNYYYKIKIGNRLYDNLGVPFVLPKYQSEQPAPVKRSFPSNLLGLCQDDPGFDADYDINKDGCIRQNDWDLFGR